MRGVFGGKDMWPLSRRYPLLAYLRERDKKKGEAGCSCQEEHIKVVPEGSFSMILLAGKGG